MLLIHRANTFAQVIAIKRVTPQHRVGNVRFSLFFPCLTGKRPPLWPRPAWRPAVRGG